MQYTVRQKTSTIRQATIEADSVEEAIELASNNYDLFADGTKEYFDDVEYDAFAKITAAG
jgi:hypothetical protein